MHYRGRLVVALHARNSALTRKESREMLFRSLITSVMSKIRNVWRICVANPASKIARTRLKITTQAEVDLIGLI